MKNEIVLFENQNVKLEVNMQDETVWLSANQMAVLFSKDEKTIRKHINNIIKDGELEKDNNTQKMRVDGVKQLVSFYNLDMIISVGYRVKSKNGIIFRKWATKILKWLDYMIKGYAVNQKRLEYLEKTVKLIDIANRSNKRLTGDETKEILRVINEYSKALDLLDNYDHKTLKKAKGNCFSKIFKCVHFYPSSPIASTSYHTSRVTLIYFLHKLCEIFFFYTICVILL